MSKLFRIFVNEFPLKALVFLFERIFSWTFHLWMEIFFQKYTGSMRFTFTSYYAKVEKSKDCCNVPPSTWINQFYDEHCGARQVCTVYVGVLLIPRVNVLGGCGDNNKCCNIVSEQEKGVAWFLCLSTTQMLNIKREIGFSRVENDVESCDSLKVKFIEFIQKKKFI